MQEVVTDVKLKEEVTVEREGALKEKTGVDWGMVKAGFRRATLGGLTIWGKFALTGEPEEIKLE